MMASPTNRPRLAPTGKPALVDEAPWCLAVGEHCGPYQVVAPIGQGGYGQVFRVRGPDGRLLALKVLRLKVDAQRRAGLRLMQEARIMQRVIHPHVVRFFDCGASSEDRRVWIAMELIDGRTLRELLLNGREELGIDRVLHLVEQIALGLAAAHAVGAVHRDVKPENVMVLPGDVIKVIDFGIAKVADSSLHTTRGNPLGTAAYMAPDYLSSATYRRKADPRWDVYAVGIVLWELFRRQHPFATDGELPTMAATVTRHLHEDIPRLTHIDPIYPAFISDLVADATARNPEHRVASMMELVTRIREARRLWCETIYPGPPTTRPSEVEDMLQTNFGSDSLVSAPQMWPRRPQNGTQPIQVLAEVSATRSPVPASTSSTQPLGYDYHAAARAASFPPPPGLEGKVSPAPSQPLPVAFAPGASATTSTSVPVRPALWLPRVDVAAKEGRPEPTAPPPRATSKPGKVLRMLVLGFIGGLMLVGTAYLGDAVNISGKRPLAEIQPLRLPRVVLVAGAAVPAVPELTTAAADRPPAPATPPSSASVPTKPPAKTAAPSTPPKRRPAAPTSTVPPDPF